MKNFVMMNAKIGEMKDLERNDLFFEPKLDGFRAFCRVEGNKLTLTSRGGLDLTNKYPNISIKNLLPYINGQNCVLDGEIVAYDNKNHINFNLLQQGHATTFYVFDILEKNGKSLTDLPLIERKKILADTVQNGPHIKVIKYSKNGPLLWKEMKKEKMEGVMAKEINGLYHEGQRSNTWLKLKFHQTIDCILIGYTSEKREISSLALGLYNKDGDLQFIGKVGTGFFTKISRLKELLEPIQTDKLPINPPKTGLPITWVKPKYVAEIRYVEITKDQNLRSPVFERLRPDKKPSSCTIADQMS